MIRIDGSTGVIITGDNATGISQKISVHGNNPLADVDLRRLANELSRLRAAMKDRGSDPDQDIALGMVAGAERAAKAGDRVGVVANLKTAGGWALGVAKDLALSLATNAIEKSISG
jgi:hypothetical protein